jgi:hypothetical protein
MRRVCVLIVAIVLNDISFDLEGINDLWSNIWGLLMWGAFALYKVFADVLQVPPLGTVGNRKIQCN